MVDAVRDAKLVIPMGSKQPLSQAVDAQTVAEKVVSGSLALGLRFYCEQGHERKNRK